MTNIDGILFAHQLNHGPDHYRVVKSIQRGVYRVQWNDNNLLDQFGIEPDEDELDDPNWRWCASPNSMVFETGFECNAVDFMELISGENITSSDWKVI